MEPEARKPETTNWKKTRIGISWGLYNVDMYNNNRTFLLIAYSRILLQYWSFKCLKCSCISPSIEHYTSWTELQQQYYRFTIKSKILLLLCLYALIMNERVSETPQTPGGRNNPRGQRPGKRALSSQVQKVPQSHLEPTRTLTVIHLYIFRLHGFCLNAIHSAGVCCCRRHAKFSQATVNAVRASALWRSDCWLISLNQLTGCHDSILILEPFKLFDDIVRILDICVLVLSFFRGAACSVGTEYLSSSRREFTNDQEAALLDY